MLIDEATSAPLVVARAETGVTRHEDVRDLVCAYPDRLPAAEMLSIGMGRAGSARGSVPRWRELHQQPDLCTAVQSAALSAPGSCLAHRLNMPTCSD